MSVGGIDVNISLLCKPDTIWYHRIIQLFPRSMRENGGPFLTKREARATLIRAAAEREIGCDVGITNDGQKERGKNYAIERTILLLVLSSFRVGSSM